MRYQDHMVRATQKAAEDVIRAALAVPSDRVEWVPMGEARAVLDQMREIATTASFLLPLIRDGRMPAMDEHARREAARMRASMSTLEQCIEETRRSVTDLTLAISAFPDSRLEEEMDLPFGGGTRLTMADVLALPSWNMTYHLGQINQIQLMLGDREMH